jgi:hypothetical protein
MVMKRYERQDSIQEAGVVRASGLRAVAESWDAVGKAGAEVADIGYKERLQQAELKGKQEGEKAVWVDPDTNIPQVVGTLPEGTRPYEVAYRNAAEARYQAELGLTSFTKAAEISNANAGNPEGFRNSWSGYVKGVTASVPEPLRAGTDVLLKEIGVKHYYKMQMEDFERTKGEAKVSTLNLVDAFERDAVDTLRETGLAGGTPEFVQGKLGMVEGLLNDQVRAGVISPEEANSRLQDHKFRLVRGMISGEAIKMAKGGKAADVPAFLDEFQRTSSDMTDDYQRGLISDFARSEVATELAKAKAEASAVQEAAKKQVKDFTEVAWKGENYALDDAQMLRIAEASGDAALVADAKAAASARATMREFSVLSPQEQAAALAASTGKNYGLRPDGTPKGGGFLGELQRPDGSVSTEISIGVNIDGKEMDIPTLVPTLTKDEINSLLSGEEPSQQIIQKAVDHARQRLAAGKSVFADTSGETGDTLKLKEKLQSIYKETQSALESKDTLQLAQRRGLITVDPLDFSNPATLTKRASDLAKVDQQMGVASNPLLPAEKEQLIKSFDGLDSDRKILLYGTLKQSMTEDVALRAMRQLGQDRPAMALAMAMSDEAPEVARTVLMGDLALQADENVLAGETDLPGTFNENIGNAIQGDDTLRNAVFHSAKAYYAQQKSRGQATTFDDAITAVTGGIAEYNGHKTIVPKRGMTGDGFEDLIDGLDDAAMSQAAGGHKIVSLDGKPVSAELVHSRGIFEWVGGGSYILKINIGNTSTGKTVFLADNNGNLLKDEWDRPIPAELDLMPFVGGL